LYRKVEPPSNPIPVHINPFDIDDEIPMGKEIELAVLQLHPGKVPGRSGIRSNHLKGWLRDAQREEAPDGTKWC